MYPKSQGPRGRGPEVLGILGPRPSGPWDLKYLGLKVRGPKVRGPKGQGLMALESEFLCLGVYINWGGAYIVPLLHTNEVFKLAP